MNGRSGVFQPMRPHSRTYQGFWVSFQRELISTMRTGAMETIRPVHTNHGFDRVAAFVSTVTVLMDFLLWNFDSLTHHLGTFSANNSTLEKFAVPAIPCPPPGASKARPQSHGANVTPSKVWKNKRVLT